MMIPRVDEGMPIKAYKLRNRGMIVNTKAITVMFAQNQESEGID